jgi:prepilin-type N-terminal cleavage/methylation domain-containing protein
LKKNPETPLKQNKGYTLIELLLCLALLSLLFCLTIPKTLTFLGDWQLEIATREVAFQLRMTQMQAIRENTAIKILCLTTLENQKIVRYFGVTPQKPYYVIPKGIQVINPATLNITYYPKGTPSVGCTIRLSNRQNHRKAIVLSPVTGRIILKQD